MKQSLSNRFLAYVRVSSKDQSRGTSLVEQRSYIERYALTKGFIIDKFYGEVESASKTGRQIFDEMIRYLKKHQLRGVVFHKTDRSARNPKDQALLYDLMLAGYELHFVSEGVSTDNPQGKNMIYMLWGMASAYSENLKAEINKGINGRLKQGKWPLPPPLGYTDAPQCTKIIDQTKGPLIKLLFEAYGTGKYTVEELIPYSRSIGLVNRNGRYLNKNVIHRILRNTFYFGLLTHRRGVFQGEHEPLITKQLFDKVQFILKERGFKIHTTYDYVFRGLLKCQFCGRRLKAMTAKKRWKYYHCRDWKCGVKTISEPILENAFIKLLGDLEFTESELDYFKSIVVKLKQTKAQSKTDQIKILDLEIANIEQRLLTMLTKFVDGILDDESYSKTREILLNRQIELRERKNNLESNGDEFTQYLNEIGKLLKNPSMAYKNADVVNKRRLIISLVGNLRLNQKELIVEWKKPFDAIVKRTKLTNGGSGGS